MNYIYNTIYSKLSTKIIYQIPYQILQLFIQLTNDNTRQLYETAAFFCGKRNSSTNTMLVNHLVIPQQPQKHDQYIITGFDHFDYIEKNKIEIGCMIHTHPNHSLFLSEPDLKTHNLLQMSNNSIISIVYAPLCMNLSTKFDISPRRHPRFKQNFINKILSNSLGFYCMTDKFVDKYRDKTMRKKLYHFLKKKSAKAYVNANNFEILFDHVEIHNVDFRHHQN